MSASGKGMIEERRGLAGTGPFLVCIALLRLTRCGGTSSFSGDGSADDAVPDDTAGDTPGDTADSSLDTETDTPIDPPSDSPADPPADPVPDTHLDPPVDPAEEPQCISDDDCMEGLICCLSRCVNPLYDPENCGGCTDSCYSAGSHFCDGGVCHATPPCDGTIVCTGTTYCCGSSCCAPGQICCIVLGPGPIGGPSCHDGFCPGGCPLCE